MSICKTWQEGDEYACSCGLRWSLNDNDPHSSAKKSKAQAHIRKLRGEIDPQMPKGFIDNSSLKDTMNTIDKEIKAHILKLRNERGLDASPAKVKTLFTHIRDLLKEINSSNGKII